MAKKKAKVRTHPNLILALAAFLLIALTSVVLAKGRTQNPTDKGFDEFGYNRQARIFEGRADGVDGQLDGKAYNLALYARDHLKMKWNSEWDRGNEEGWANPPYNAWLDNNWNGKVPGGSGEVWQYRIKWIGSCGATGTKTADGGYCIWGQFEVVLSHGTVVNQHFWDAHAIPAGFGN